MFLKSIFRKWRLTPRKQYLSVRGERPMDQGEHLWLDPGNTLILLDLGFFIKSAFQEVLFDINFTGNSIMEKGH